MILPCYIGLARELIFPNSEHYYISHTPMYNPDFPFILKQCFVLKANHINHINQVDLED
jgi:hypothetical protein